jgi:hypothetical protein
MTILTMLSKKLSNETTIDINERPAVKLLNVHLRRILTHQMN